MPCLMRLAVKHCGTAVMICRPRWRFDDRRSAASARTAALREARSAKRGPAAPAATTLRQRRRRPPSQIKPDRESGMRCAADMNYMFDDRLLCCRLIFLRVCRYHARYAVAEGPALSLPPPRVCDFCCRFCSPQFYFRCLSLSVFTMPCPPQYFAPATRVRHAAIFCHATARQLSFTLSAPVFHQSPPADTRHSDISFFRTTHNVTMPPVPSSRLSLPSL